MIHQQQQKQTQQIDNLKLSTNNNTSTNILPSLQLKMNDSPRGLMNLSGLFDAGLNDNSFFDPFSFANTLSIDTDVINDNCNLFDSFSEQDLMNLTSTDFAENLNTPNNFEFTDKKECSDQLESDFAQLATPNSACSFNKFEDRFENNLDLNLYMPAAMNMNANSMSSLSDLTPIQFDDVAMNKVPSRQNSLNFQLDLDDEQFKMITPTIEKLCFDFIHQSPSVCDNESQSQFAEALDQRNSILNFVDQELGQIDNEAKLGSVLVDHDYAIASKKRKIDNDESVEAETSQKAAGVFKLPATSANKAKKQRTRGVYRADDVKNEEDLKNYLERRRKNNISSKASRQSKKQQYVEMDAKSDKLKKENQKLTEITEEYSDVIRKLKDILLEKCTSKK